MPFDYRKSPAQWAAYDASFLTDEELDQYRREARAASRRKRFVLVDVEHRIAAEHDEQEVRW